MLARPQHRDGGIVRGIAVGDLYNMSEADYATLTTAGAGTILGPMVANGVLNRTGPAGGFADTWPSAQAIIDAMGGNNALQAGDSWRLLYRNTVAQAMTSAAPANGGIVLGTNVDTAASLVREYRLRVLANKAGSLVSGTTDGVGAVVTGLTTAQTALLQVGQAVYGANIAAAAFIVSIADTTFTMSANSTGAGTQVLTITPRIDIYGLRSSTL